MARDDTVVRSTTTRTTGLLASLRQLLATSAEVLGTRVAILSTELEEEGLRVRELILFEQMSLFFLGLGLLLTTLCVVLAFWETHRLLVLAAFAVFYLTIGTGIALVIRHKLKTRPRMFSTTLSELGKDRERLVSRS
jgi:uncharacterized membrane protein YqjE